MTCLALDDEPLPLQLLESYISLLPALQPCGFYNNPDEAKARLMTGDVDLLFLDIQMPDITGLQFLKQLEQPPMVVFTTAFSDFAVEGFNLDAVDYLLKPFDFQRFEKAVKKALEYKSFKDQQSGGVQPQVATCLFVKVEYSVIQIPFGDIQHIEAFDDYIKIFAGGKSILSLMALKNVQTQLPADQFIRIHRSYIVAVSKVEKIRAQKITISGVELPIGESYKNVVKAMFKQPE
jgi:DNA-binding LytR/AlgR family response regulator